MCDDEVYDHSSCSKIYHNRIYFIEYILLTDINEPHMFKYVGIYIYFFCEVNENVNNVKVYFDVLKNLFDLFVGITI